MTVFEISELVTDAPRGEVIKTIFEKYFPEASKIPGYGYILKLLPSYGGDWELPKMMILEKFYNLMWLAIDNIKQTAPQKLAY